MGRERSAWGAIGRGLTQALRRIACGNLSPTATSLVMVLLEFSLTPLGRGESITPLVARCLDIVDKSGLDYQLHAMGTTVEGRLSEVLGLMERCIEALAADHNRVTCTAKLDYRQGRHDRLRKKVTSVEEELGRTLKT